MSDDNLNIEEIREKCNAAIDYLKDEFSRMSNSTKAKVDKFVEDNSFTFAIVNSNFLEKILTAVKYGLNIFAASVLGIDREFLDFSSYKEKDKKKNNVDLKYGTVNLLNNTILTLDIVKEKILNDDSQLLFFYRGLVSINDYNFWYVIYNTLEKMDIDIKYSVNDRKFFLGDDASKSYTPNRRVENGIYNILGSNELTKSTRTR